MAPLQRRILEVMSPASLEQKKSKHAIESRFAVPPHLVHSSRA